jgi:hypothetical protein
MDTQQPDSQQEDNSSDVHTQQQDSQSLLGDEVYTQQQQQDSQSLLGDDSTGEVYSTSEDEQPLKFNEDKEFKEINEKLEQGDHSFCFGTLLTILTLLDDEDVEIEKLLRIIEACQKNISTTKRTTRFTLKKNNMKISHVKAFIYHVQEHEKEYILK